MTTDRLDVRIETDDSKIIYADVEVKFQLDLNFGADADGNRSSTRMCIEDIEVVSAWDVDSNEIELTEEINNLIIDQATEKFNDR